ncbi:DUF2807 domain-containing protein [Flavobacterium sp. MFBS3-15]|uniref:head GIN domain-containing protein n=1 Tax=Flavobacterium sp. MFBS3-15 TaxID=2989816 RepID=UPI0022360644|nr:head GIN domain-containing protein [Flavobacterium sp. MFBS3-15]MCW4468921.1 DUF2807 domain-containing protein [Flavobacterium sp. MFBS3-15]
MKKAAMFLAGLCFTLSVTAQEKKERVQGTGKSIKEKREMGAAYHKVSVTGNFEVTLVSGETGTITLEGEENLIEFISATVTDGELSISSGERYLVPSRNKKIAVKVPVGILNEVTLKGSGSIYVKNKVKNNVKVMLDGPGSIDLNVAANDVEAIVLGSGQITIEGNANMFDCRVVGSGTIKAYELKAPVVSALVSGSGNVETNSSKSLKGRISGSGNIAFTGEPKETDLKHSGSGKFSLHQ